MKENQKRKRGGGRRGDNITSKCANDLENGGPGRPDLRSRGDHEWRRGGNLNCRGLLLTGEYME